jgi:hypothetical protein
MKEAIPLAESYLVQLELEGISLTTLLEDAQISSGLEKSVVRIDFIHMPDETNEEDDLISLMAGGYLNQG